MNHVSCVSNVANGLWILHSLIDPSDFSNVYMSPIHIFQ